MLNQATLLSGVMVTLKTVTGVVADTEGKALLPDSVNRRATQNSIPI